MAKGGSKLITGIISFLLGFIFAILVEVGAIFGVGWYVMTTDINSLLGTLGLQNVDENGNNVYINTDVENGGVANLKELFAGIKGLAYEDGQFSLLGKSFDDIEELLPVTNIVLGFVYSAIDDVMELDREEFESTPMTDLAQVLSDSLMNVKTVALLQKLGMLDSFAGDDANLIVKSLLLGAETEYATVSYNDLTATAAAGDESDQGEPASPLKLPVFYDIYRLDKSMPELGYQRNQPISDGKVSYPDNLGDNYDWLQPMSREETDGEAGEYEYYYLYYVPCRVTATGVEQAEYISGEEVVTDGAGSGAKSYRFSVMEYGDDTDFIVVKPDGNGGFVLNYNEVYSTLNGGTSDPSLRFTGRSYYAPYAREYYNIAKNGDGYEFSTVCGKNYFRNKDNEIVQLDARTLGDLVSNDTMFDPLYSVPACDALGENSDVAYQLFGKTSVGALMNGEVDFNKLANDADVGAFITNVAPSNSVMAYIVYKVSDLNDTGTTDSGGYSNYTAVYDKGGEHEQNVTVKVKDNKIVSVVNADGELDGVKVKDVAALANSMPVTVVMSIRADEAIMTYLGYGLTGVKAAESGSADSLGNAYEYTGEIKLDGEESPRTCYLSTRQSDEGNPVVRDVWYIDDNGERVEVNGTPIMQVSSKVENFTDDLTLGEVLKLDGSESKILNSIKNSKISGLDDTIKTLKVSDIIDADEIENSTILRQLKNVSVTDLATEVDKVSIQSIYADEIYGKAENGESKNLEELAVDEYHSDWLYYEKTEDGEFKFVNDGDEETQGHLEESDFVAGRYYSYGQAQGMWKLVLYKNGAEKVYTINNFNNMVLSCAQNVNNSTLTELKAAGIIQADDAALAKKLTGSDGTQYTLGDMTLATLVNVVIGLSN